MSILPTQKGKITAKNPGIMVIYGHTKQGKTTLAANLDNNLIIDLEGGSRYYNCMRIDVLQDSSKEKGVTPWDVIASTIRELKTYKETHNGTNLYKFITVDTVGHLEDAIMPYAIKLYQNSSTGKGFKGNASDLKGLPHGAGWGPIREALFLTIASLSLYCETLILIAHSKSKTVKRDTAELEIEDIDISGKMAQMLAGKADAIALIYRQKNKTILDFRTSENLAAGSRIDHLRERMIVACESDADGKLTFHWDQLFIN